VSTEIEKAEVEICNLALNGIGHTQFITSLDEDSVEANVCKLSYPQIRDEALEVLKPSFATRRSRPAALVATTLDLGAVPGGWKYAYALPADCVPNGLREVQSSDGSSVRNPRPDQEIPFAIEYDSKTGQVLVLTDQEKAELVYTARLEDATKYTATFLRALAERMGPDLVRGIRKDPRLLQQAAATSASATAAAVSSAGRAEKVSPEDPVPFHIAAR
jgi:hypothetical protein